MSEAMVSCDTELINGMFIPAAAQLDIVRRRNVEHKWGFTDDDFAALGDPPPWPDDPLSAVILDVSLDTPQQTFEEAWHFASTAQPTQFPVDNFTFDSNHLRLLPGITHKRGLRWVVVDLDANWDRKNGISPADVRNAKTSPHSAIIWAAGYFPKWVRAMDGKTVPYVSIPGYQVTIWWAHVPGLYWWRMREGVQLLTLRAQDRDPTWAVPRIRK